MYQSAADKDSRMDMVTLIPASMSRGRTKVEDLTWNSIANKSNKATACLRCLLVLAESVDILTVRGRCHQVHRGRQESAELLDHSGDAASLHFHAVCLPLHGLQSLRCCYLLIVVVFCESGLLGGTSQSMMACT